MLGSDAEAGAARQGSRITRSVADHARRSRHEILIFVSTNRHSVYLRAARHNQQE
jgi:hypothetical protein